MATSNTFLLNVKHDFIENRKTILLSVGSLWGACILFGGLMGYYGRGGGAAEAFFFTFMLVTAGYVCASMMFSNMKRKESRIAALMLPASMEEKFITRWIAFVPLLFGVLIAAFYLGDLSRVLVNYLSNNPVNGRYSHVINLFSVMTANNFMPRTWIYTIISFYFFYQSLFIFGAILWPKLSFIKTLGALWVLQTLIGIIGISIDNHLNFSPYDADEVLIWTGIGLNILTIAMYALTYYRFKRSQVIYNLF